MTAMVEPYTEKNIESFHQDVATWNHKCIIDNPPMCDGDGPTVASVLAYR